MVTIIERKPVSVAEALRQLGYDPDQKGLRGRVMLRTFDKYKYYSFRRYQDGRFQTRCGPLTKANITYLDGKLSTIAFAVYDESL